MRKLMSAGRADGRNYNCVWGHMKALYRVLLQTLHESFSSWSGLCIEVQTGSCLDLSLCQNCCEVGFVCCWFFFFSSATVRSTINRISFLWRQHQARHHTVWGSNCNTCCWFIVSNFSCGESASSVPSIKLQWFQEELWLLATSEYLPLST